MKKGSKLDTASYKGVRDFYPEDMFVLNYVMSVMRRTVESFGYQEYGASPIEPAELFRAKTGEEIVNEQTYTFTDRGGREVTLRPEMTPTVARMVAAKRRDLVFPLRWYSIPNLFRYEQPQKGRLREHFQLNVDIFGVAGLEAEIEIINVAWAIMNNYGAKESDFEIRINSRELIKELFLSFKIKESESRMISRVMDKKDKISSDTFKMGLEEILKDKAGEFIRTFEVNQRIVDRLGSDNPKIKKIETLINKLDSSGIKNIFLTPTLMRGLDYYTDIVFEIYDTNKDNRRSLFGGGRYDSLTELFGEEAIPAVGFGMGDVTIGDFLIGRRLVPPYKSSVNLHICRAGEIDSAFIFSFANKLREKGVNNSIDFSKRKVSDQIKSADKSKIPFVVCVGEKEVETKKFAVKRLSTGEEKILGEDDIPNLVLN
jgi:histidyl-tRNA synthetase